MKHWSDYKNIIFDLDGTLIDSMGIWREIDMKFLNKRNIEMPEKLFAGLPSNNLNDTALYLKERFQLPDTVEEILSEWHQNMLQHYEKSIGLKPFVSDFVQKLKESDKVLAVGTSNSRALTEIILSRFGLLGHFATIVTGCGDIKGKPLPDIYLKVAENLKVEPAECLVFEDSLPGVQAAKNAGMTVYAIADPSAEKYKEKIISIADRYFTCYSQ
ncbi:MAG: HAD family phosphatase, partial [Candidatus Cloacimonetes bacterium]|nr:HAD family phosphatase [Candidatus Cloacimonadota bacterium]